jgi:DnaJ-class molecular chaperone
MKNPYEVLGVSKTATQDEIKSAYRKLAKKLHPDLNPGNKEIENKFKEVAAAYELIGTADQRAKYDRGETQEQQQQQWQQQRQYSRGQGPFYWETQGGGGDSRYSFSDIDPEIFESIFGQARGGGFGGSGRQRQRGPQDSHYQLEIDLKDAVLGAEKEITLPSGKRLKVKIPPGIKSGQKLRLAGQGDGGGDAYIEIIERPSEKFRRVGDDLYIDAPISFADAILSGDVIVPTIDGQVSLKIPKGVTTGTKIRVKGKGAPKRGGGRGDQIVNVQIDIPKDIDPQLENAVREWSRNHEKL